MISWDDSADVIVLNLKLMSCKACLSAGRVSINDTDDTDDGEEISTTSLKARLRMDMQINFITILGTSVYT